MDEDEIDARLSAHRAAIFALALVMDEAKPGAFENVIEVLATFEGAASSNMPAAFVDEVRAIREGLQSQHGDAQNPETPSPPRRSDPGS